MNYVCCLFFSYLVLLSLAITTGWAQVPTNYIISRTYKQAGVAEDPTQPILLATSAQVQTQIMYYDGLGKPVQQVMAFGAASKGDIIQLTEYDNQFRPSQTFLPAPFTTNGGGPQSGGEIKTKLRDYYKDSQKVSATIDQNAPDAARSAQTRYENSPLSRVSQQRAPGASSVVTQNHGVNSEAEVRFFRTTGSGLTAIEQAGHYAAQELTYVQTIDETDGAKVTQYQDRHSRTVLKRVLSEDGNLDTYYVYDEQGQLRAVLQPKYLKQGETDLNRNAFLYRYDAYGRLVEKKVPGANASQMSYQGTTELLETSTDGNGQKFYYQYDNLNRQTEQGLCKAGNCSDREPLLRTYYDDYSFGPFQGYSAEPSLTGLQFADNPQVARIGLVTGQSARALLADGTYGGWLQKVIYYDHKYRVLQTLRQLYGFQSNAFERVSYQLGFDGRVEQEWTTQATGSVHYKLAKTFTYDHANRLIRTDHELFENDVSKKTYTHVEQLYNEVGQLAAKSLHGGMSILRSKYTPRGWLGEHRSDAVGTFSLGLSYQDNGNISSQSWATRNYSGGMSLGYDKAGRLINATGTGNFAGQRESPIQYDPNGNITGLSRTFNNVSIDQLAYQYHGNQLHRVDDNNNNESQLVKGFVNGANVDDELAYDGNGNLVRDDNRGVSSVAYNVLNLPRSVVRNNRTVNYTYDASGAKLRSEAPDNVNTYYAGSFEYRAENSLLRIGLEEGQLVKEGSRYVVQYYLRDHLGNVRAVLDETGAVVQETEYYAFGLAVQHGGSDKNKYLYNGKEVQAETEWLDYGARMYDPTIGRWNNIDPRSETSLDGSPYTYVSDNPLRFIDPDGMQGQSTHTDKHGNVVAVFDDGDLGVYRHEGDQEQATKEVSEKYDSKNYTSAGGEYMGETLHSLSFANHDLYNEKGKVEAAPGAKIDFESSWAQQQVGEILKNDPSALEYQSKAGRGGVWDLKAHAPGATPPLRATYGSIIGINHRGNIYASARDAGNFAAGAVADRSNWPTSMILNGFGAYNITSASKPFAAALYALDYMHPPAPFLSLSPTHGEDKVTFMAISAGLKRHTQLFPVPRW